MYIVNIQQLDNNGRIKTTGFIHGSKKVLLVIDTEKEMIKVITGEEAENNQSALILDDKNRLTIPKWIRDELKTDKLLLVDMGNGDKYISPKTGDVL